MSLAIRRVSLVDDRQEMLELLNRNFGPIQEQRFKWRHIDNPAGTCWTWFAYAPNGKSPVAMATVFPRHMRIDGERIRAGQVGEFAVDATYRSLGPAVQMQRTTFEPVDSGALAFCYDCTPHDRGMSTFVRLGMRPNCEVYRYALPLRCDEYVEKRLGNGAWTKPLIATVNLLLRTPRSKRSMRGLEISRFDGSFGDEFSRVDEVAPSSGLIRASRHAEDLNWRYRLDPLAPSCSADGSAGEYRVLVARRAGELQAFAVFFVQTDGIASLVDLFGLSLPQAGAALLEATIDVCRSQNASSLHGFCSEESELRPLFRQAGMRRREKNAGVVAYAKPAHPAGQRVDAGMRWSFSQVEVML